MKITACMIVKNEEKTLDLTLPALKAGVDEIILVDTGSTDNTVALAEKFGARVFHFPWVNDFSAARNQSLKPATGDWIIWIDADEFIRPEDLVALRRELERTQEEALMLPIYECRFGTTEGSTFYFRIKAFRNGRGFHFERPFNEQVYKTPGVDYETTALLPSIRISHWGRDLNQQKTQDKKERNFKLLEEALHNNPEDPYFHYLLANNYLDIGEKDKAEAEYARVSELKNQTLALLSDIKRARLLIEKKQYDEAYTLLKPAAAAQTWNAEIYNLIAVIYLFLDNADKAIQVLDYSSQLKLPQDCIAGVDVTQFGYFPNFLLGNAYLLSGDKSKALAAFKAAYAYQPDEGLKQKLIKLSEEVSANG